MQKQRVEVLRVTHDEDDPEILVEVMVENVGEKTVMGTFLIPWDVRVDHSTSDYIYIEPDFESWGSVMETGENYDGQELPKAVRDAVSEYVDSSQALYDSIKTPVLERDQVGV